MKNQSLYAIAAFLVLLITGIYACKKVNGINNRTVVETPYSLYFSDTAGTLFNSNDGKNIKKVVFPPDGFPCKAICVSADNILFGKTNLYISTNNGVNFNHSFDSFGNYPGVACNGLPINLNQSMMINIPDWNRVYTVANEDWAGNYLGLRFSYAHGLAGSWYTEGRPDTNGAFGFYGEWPYTVTITSLTMLKNNTLCGYDARHNRNGYKLKETLWKETTAGGIYGVGSAYDHSGRQLPFSDTVIGDTSARYSLGHFNNRLIAIDNKGCHDTSAYYSDDTGRRWYGCYGLPAHTPMLCIASPFEETCLIGTDRAGLYMLNLNTMTFELNINGLTRDLRIRNIAFKENIYKNGTYQRYIYLATDRGIFQSTDGGHNWILTIQGNYVAIY